MKQMRKLDSEKESKRDSQGAADTDKNALTWSQKLGPMLHPLGVYILAPADWSVFTMPKESRKSE